MNPLSINLQLKKTLLNKENGNGASSSSKKDEDNGGETCIPVNCVAFNQNEKF
jgi:hypothetical protein